MPELVEISGSFSPQGTSPPLAAHNGQEFMVQRLDVGMYLLTFYQPFGALLGGSAQLQLHTPILAGAVLGDFKAWTASRLATLVIVAMGSSGALDIAADKNNTILFHFIFKRN